jgi:hypothetical protein
MGNRVHVDLTCQRIVFVFLILLIVETHRIGKETVSVLIAQIAANRTGGQLERVTLASARPDLNRPVIPIEIPDRDRIEAMRIIRRYTLQGGFQVAVELCHGISFARNAGVSLRVGSWMLLALITTLGVNPIVVAREPRVPLEFLDDFSQRWDQQREPLEERIETERHDFTQSATTVGRGVIQVESGYTYFYKETPEETESNHTLPELLLRIGLTEDIEARLRWNHAWVFVRDEEDRIGSEDLRYSLKLQMTREHEHNLLPTSALEIRGSAPTGGDEFTTGEVEISLDYIFQWTLVEGVTLAGSTGWGTDGFGDFGLVPDAARRESYDAYSVSAVLGGELGERNTAYAEWFGIFSDGLAEEFSISVFNVGIDHYINRDFVVDFRVGVGLSADSDDFFSGIGGGYRF